MDDIWVYAESYYIATIKSMEGQYGFRRSNDSFGYTFNLKHFCEKGRNQ